MDPIIDISHINDYNFTLPLKRELTKELHFICYLIILIVLTVVLFSLVILLCLRNIRKTNDVVTDNLLKYNEKVEKIIDANYQQLA